MNTLHGKTVLRRLSQRPAVAASRRTGAMAYGDTFFLASFALRQWDDPKFSGTRVDYDKHEFINKYVLHMHAHATWGTTSPCMHACMHTSCAQNCAALLLHSWHTFKNASSPHPT